MSRLFNGTSDQVTNALGRVATAPATDRSFAAIFRPTRTTGFNALMSLNTSADVKVCDFTISSGLLRIENVTQASTGIAISVNEWVCAWCTKAAGTTVVNSNKYTYSTAAYGTNVASATLANPSGTIAKSFLGSISGTDFFEGEILLIAEWDRVLPTVELQNLPFSLAHWYAADPNAMWLLDQADVAMGITDLVGGAHQSAISGTAVGSQKGTTFNYTDGGIWVPASVSGTGWAEPVNDALSMADDIAISRGLAIGDTLSMADAATPVSVYFRTVPDALSLADSAVPSAGFNVGVNDGLSVADSATPVSGKEALVNDGLSIADSATLGQGKGLAEALSVADAQALARAMIMDDPLSMADSVTPALGKDVAINDGISLADALALGFGEGISDSLGMADAASTLAVLQRVVSDSIGMADAVSLGQGKGLTEALSIAEGVTTVAAYLRSVADDIFIADLASPQSSGAGAITIPDTLTLTDTLVFDRGIAVSDALSMADARAFVVGYARLLADTLSIADLAALVSQRVITFNDALTLADQVLPGLGRTLLVADALGITDFVVFDSTTGTVIWPENPPGAVRAGSTGSILGRTDGTVDGGRGTGFVAPPTTGTVG